MRIAKSKRFSDLTMALQLYRLEWQDGVYFSADIFGVFDGLE